MISTSRSEDYEVASNENALFDNQTRRIFAFTRALCLGETLVLLDVVSQHIAYLVT